MVADEGLAQKLRLAALVTEKQQIILARRGQGKFRERVSRIEYACRITGVIRPGHLIASHCKPWRDCGSHDERLDGENGLLLTPIVDHLFDRGFISFENDGELFISPLVLEEPCMLRVVAITDKSEVRGLGLQIQLQPGVA